MTQPCMDIYLLDFFALPIPKIRTEYSLLSFLRPVHWDCWSARVASIDFQLVFWVVLILLLNVCINCYNEYVPPLLPLYFRWQSSGVPIGWQSGQSWQTAWGCSSAHFGDVTRRHAIAVYDLINEDECWAILFSQKTIWWLAEFVRGWMASSFVGQAWPAMTCFIRHCKSTDMQVSRLQKAWGSALGTSWLKLRLMSYYNRCESVLASHENYRKDQPSTCIAPKRSTAIDGPLHEDGVSQSCQC